MAQQMRQASRQPAPQQDDWEGAEPTDLADSGYGGGGIVPEGWYDIEVVKAAIRNSNSSGLDYPNFDLQIIDGDQSGRHTFCGIFINSPADSFRKGQKAFLAKWFEVCTGQIPSEVPKTDDDLADLVGARASVHVIVEDNKDLQGNTVQQNRVVRVRPLGEVQQPANRARTQQTAQTQRTATSATTQPQNARSAPSRTNGGAQQSAQRQQTRRPAAQGSFSDMNDDIPFADPYRNHVAALSA
jgi:hypothetical protein